MAHSHSTSLLRTASAGLLIAGLIYASFGTLLIGVPRSARAAPATAIVVTTNADDSIVNGNCTLREAIQAANTDAAVDACAAGSGADTITFAGNYTIVLGSILNVAQSLTLDGSGHTVILDGNHAVGVLNATAPITVRYLTIQNGGGVTTGGGLSVNADATIDHVTFLNNQASMQGGGLYANAPVTITYSSFTGNQVTVYSPSAYGGAVHFGDQATVSNTTFNDNSSANYGGAFTTEPGNGPLLVMISGSTFISNTAQTGGAIVTWDPLSVINSTFSGNTASGSATSGGAMALAYTTSITNATISDSTGSGIQGSGPVSLVNTIIANSLTGSDCTATVGTNLNNLFEDGTCSPSVSGDPLLGSLANNGGSTQTFALLPGSPALDAGDNAACPATDQRGVARPQNGVCDIGAFESTIQPGPNFQVNSTADTDDGVCDFAPASTCTLREAMNAANARNGADTITFAVNGTISLSSTLPFITEALTIDGTGHAITLDGNNAVRVMVVSWSVPVTVTTFTIKNGLANTAVGIVAKAGGGILNLGNLVVDKSTFSNNTAVDFGGALNNYTGALIVTNSTFSGNSANNSGGGIFADGTVTVTNSTFSGNSALNTGGGVTRNTGTMTLRNTIVASSSSGGNCAGVITNGGNNLDSGTTCGFGSANGSYSNVNSRLAPLADYGGSTATFALLPGSPAIDAGNVTTCAATDQRGVARSLYGACDSGAFESRGFMLIKISGDDQSTAPNATFSVPLVATVSSAYGEPVDSGQVTFVGPASGPSLTPITSTAIIVGGLASINVTANGINGGPYAVTASARGTTPVIYTLLNNSAPTLGIIGDQTTAEDVTRGPIPLSITDIGSPANEIIVTGTSSNPVLVPNSDILFNGSGTNRSISLIPASNQFGSAQIAITVSDGYASTQRSFNFTVTPANDAPDSIGLSSSIVSENQPIGTAIGTLSTVDVDPGDTHTFTFAAGAGDADNAAFQITQNVLKTNAVFDYETRNAYSIRLRATDSGGLSVERSFTISVTNVNDPPTAQPDFATTTSGQSITVTVLANDTDQDANPLQVVGVGTPTSGVASLNGNLVIYTPPLGFVGTVTFTYTVSDAQGGFDSALVTILITPGTSPLVIIAPDVVTTTEDTPVLISPLVNDSAPQTLSLAFVEPTNGGTASIIGTQLLFTPTLNFNGVTTFTYAALAGTAGGGQAVITVTVLPVNDPPVAGNDSAITPEETPVTINLLLNGTDVDGDPITLVNVNQGLHGLVEISGTGVITYTPFAGYHGPDQLSYDISDGQGGIATGLVEINVTEVNRPPVAARDDVLADEDTPVAIDVLANDTDPNSGDTLQVVNVTQAQSGTVTLLPNGLVQYLPDADYNGPDRFAYTIADNRGLTSIASVSLTVRPVLDVPLPNPVTGATNANQPTGINVLSQTVNADNLPLNITGYTQPQSGTVTLQPNGTFWFTPTTGFQGFTEFTYTLGISGTALKAERSGFAPQADRSARVTIAVGNITDTATIISKTADLSAGTRTQLNPLANVNCQTARPITNRPSGLANLVLIGLQRRIGLAAANPDGTVSYTPPPGFSGTDVVTYTVSDGAGCYGTGVITVTVLAVPRPPNAIDDLVAGTEDTPMTIAVAANDYDLSGSPITVTAVSQPAHGQTSLNPNGTVAYTPTLDFYGIDQLSYTIVNARGLTGLGTAYVVIANVNDPPVARNDLALVMEDTPTIIPVTANDTDPDGDLLTVTPGQPSHGMVTVTPLGTLWYRPVANYNGTDVMTYTVNDGHGGMATAVVSINITPVNDPPVAITDTTTITGGQSIWIDALANDFDVDSPHLLLTDVGASSGTAYIQNNLIRYIPLPGSARIDTLTYVVSDEQGGQATGTVVVTVLATPPTVYTLFLPLLRR